jgi:hypothetical protein
MQRSPAALPRGIPGIGDEIDGAIQQAPHPLRHCSDSMERFFIRDFFLLVASRYPVDALFGKISF